MRKLFTLALLSSTFLFAKDHHIGGGVQSANLAIKQGGANSKQVGWLTGLRAEYQYRTDYYFNAYLEKSWGDLTSYTVQDFWTEGTFGYNIQWKGKSFIPYVGLGYQFFKQFRHVTDVSISTYHPYIPVGLYFEAMIHTRLKMGLNVKGLFSLRTLDHVGGFPGSYWEVKRKNDLFIEVPLILHDEVEGRIWDLSFVPYYRRVRFGPTYSKNAAGVGIGITAESNRYLGMRVTLNYAF